MKTVLVTGGSGFIGAHLVNALAGGPHRVIAFDLYPRAYETAPDASLSIQGNLNDGELVRRTLVDEGVEVIVHAAWATIHETSLEDPAADVQANLVPTLRLLEAARESGVQRFVFLSSGGQVYGIPATTPTREDHPTHPLSPYGVAKLAVEKYAWMYDHLYGIESVVLRPSVPYGPRQNPRRRQGAVSVFTHHALQGLPVEIWGDGDVRRDYFYIEDLARALEEAVDHPAAAGQVINLGGPRAVSLNELVEIIEDTLGVRIEVRYRDSARRFDAPTIDLDCTRARDLLGWSPRVDLPEGIRRTAAWQARWFDGTLEQG